jgi:hypothetical protein
VQTAKTEHSNEGSIPSIEFLRSTPGKIVIRQPQVSTEAAWLNGNNWEKKEISEAEREKKRKDERKVLTLTGLLMEEVTAECRIAR